MIDYEEQRRLNIQRNRETLAQLGLGTALFAVPPPTSGGVANANSKAKTTAKRARVSEPAPKKKARRVLASVKNDSDSTGLRRSSRVSGHRISYADDNTDTRSVLSTPAKKTARVKSEEDYEDGSEDEGEDAYQKTPQRKAQRLGKRTQDPKTFGHIPGVEVGTWWDSRMDCSTAAIHGPPVCGIAGTAKGGAFSIALSGGYEDDIDEGYAFTYTGAGGRDLKGTKENRKNLRTAPQSKDQSFDTTFNQALLKSVETKYPVRVVRGFKLDSKYAPRTGYRYDGLYVVEKAWMETGLNPGGFKVCKFALRRLPDQPPIPVNKRWGSKDTTESDDADEDEEDIDEEDEDTVEDEVKSEDSEENKENETED